MFGYSTSTTNNYIIILINLEDNIFTFPNKDTQVILYSLSWMRNWFRTSQIQLPFLLFLPSFLQIDGADMKKIDRRRLVAKTAVRTIPFCFQRVYSLDTSFVNCILNYNRIRNYAGRVVNDNNYSLIIY